MISDRMFTTDDIVRAAYRTLLDREPENDTVVREAAATFDAVEPILRQFMQSVEFKERQATHNFLSLVGLGHGQRRQPIQVNVSAAQLDALFERIRRQWSALGESDPYWSVLTDDKYRRHSFEDNRAAFENSGNTCVQLLKAAIERTGVVWPQGTCIELGCGVGRVTRHLAGAFDQVIGIDVSPGNLAICKDYLGQSQISNAELRLLQSPADLADLPSCDMLYSILVLQHNPPPVIKHTLEQMLAKIRPGGMAYFQVPTHTLNYTFSVDAYLASGAAELDMHLLPMAEVLGCIQRAGLEVIEVLVDGWTGRYGSHTFLATKPVPK